MLLFVQAERSGCLTGAFVGKREDGRLRTTKENDIE